MISFNNLFNTWKSKGIKDIATKIKNIVNMRNPLEDRSVKTVEGTQKRGKNFCPINIPYDNSWQLLFEITDFCHIRDMDIVFTGQNHSMTVRLGLTVIFALCERSDNTIPTHWFSHNEDNFRNNHFDISTPLLAETLISRHTNINRSGGGWVLKNRNRGIGINRLSV